MESLSSGLVLARRNIGLQMRQHALGYAWAVLTPAIYAVFYIFVRSALHGKGVDSSGAAAHWDVIRAFSGISMIQTWFQLLRDASGLVRTNRAFFRGLNVSPTPFVVASLSEALLNFAIRLGLIVAAVLLFGLPLPPEGGSWIAILLSLAGLILSATALGLFLAPWAALYLDVQKAISTISLPLMLISPVFYPAVENPDVGLYWINVINPLAPALALLNLALRGDAVLSSNYLIPFALHLAISLCLILICLKSLPRAIQILLERLGN